MRPKLIMGAFLALCLVAAPAAAQLEKCADYMKMPAAGSWAEYQTKEGSLRMSVLGEEEHEGKKMQRLEMSVGGEGGTVVQMVVPGWPYQPDGIYEMVMKTEGQPAMKMSGRMMDMMRQNMKTPTAQMADACERMVDLGTETVTVPAGTFETRHYRDQKTGAEVWVDADLPFGMVKTLTKDGEEMVLTAHGTGAKSRITETPVEMPGMGG